MPIRKNLRGKKFHRLIVVAALKKRQNGHVVWKCRCECGMLAFATSTNLINEKVKSCGCLKKELLTVHGHASRQVKSSTYSVWRGVIDRCTNPKQAAYQDYGGRGIKVCERWLKFENFLADMGERPEGKELDRKNNDGDYEPNNCRWVTHRSNMNNTRRNVYITHEGKTRTLSQWARKTGMNRNTLKARIRMGWSISEVLATC